MQTSNRIIDDITRLATGAAGALSGAKGEVEDLVKQRLERLIAEMDVVTREEFDAVAQMAAKAREIQESQQAEIEELRTRIDQLTA